MYQLRLSRPTAIVFALISLLSLFTQNSWAQIDSSLLQPVDIPPLFEGCDDPLISAEQRQACSAPKLQAFISEHIQYPDSARSRGVEGVVVVRFYVTETGKITSLELLRDIGAGCGSEALRVVRMMPNFKPALRDGKAVATSMVLPIRFKQENSKEKGAAYQLHWGNVYQAKISKKNLQSLLKRFLLVRDRYGNTHEVQYLNVSIQQGDKTIVSLEGKGNILTKEMVKKLRRLRSGQRILLSATIEDNYEQIEVKRSLELLP